MKNKYIKLTHISERKFREILRCFCQDITASDTAALTGLSRVSINRIFHKLRRHLAKHYCQEGLQDGGEFERDESYFGAKRVRGKRGRGAAGKTPVFGLLKREGKVSVQIVANGSRTELMPIIQGKILKGSTIHTDGWKAYDGLVLKGYAHYRVFHSKDEFARGKSHINGIEAFWSFAKRRMATFNGLAEHTFYLHLKESEFRYHHRQQNSYQLLLKWLNKNPI